MKVQKPIVGRMFLVVVLHGEGWDTEHYEQDTSITLILDILCIIILAAPRL